MAEAPAEQQKDRGLVEYQSRDGQQIKLTFDTVRRYLVSGKPELVTDQELILYMGTCKARGLNPFKKDCYLVKYTQDDPAATIVSIDYFRSRARAQDDCQGWQAGVIVQDAGGALAYRNGAFTFPGDTLLGGWFRAKPQGWAEPYEWAVNLKPYIKTTRLGGVTRFWNEDNQPAQIAKVAESQGLRRVWPDEFQTLFTADEIIDTTATHEDEPPPPRPAITEPVRKVNEKERKRFYGAAQALSLTDDEINRKLSEYGYKNTYDIMTDKLPELMTWATKLERADKAPPAEQKKEESPA